MKTGLRYLMMVWMGAAVAMGQASSPSSSANASPSSANAAAPQQIRPIGVVTQIQPGNLSLHTDSGSELLVLLPYGVTVVRVPPGAKDLKTATKIAVTDINSGDRIIVRGTLAEDQKSVKAASVMVMTKTDLTSAHEAERLEWSRRGIGGPVKVVNPATKEITISVPNSPPAAGNPNHSVTIALAPNATLLRYAPDSVKFSDARPGAFEEIKAGDQIRALGTKSQDGNRFTAEKLVSGAFRNLGATVVSVDAQNGAVTVKDLASGKPVLVRTNGDSKLHRLPPFIAQMIAMYNSGQMPGGATGGQTAAGGQVGGAASGGAGWRPTGGGGGRSSSGGSGLRAGGGDSRGGPGGGPGSGMTGAPRDFNQMLDRTPPLKLDELKPGDALIVVSTEGAKPSEVTAIVLLAGVEPILAARPKGSTDVNLGQWNMSMGGGDAGP